MTILDYFHATKIAETKHDLDKILSCFKKEDKKRKIIIGVPLVCFICLLIAWRVLAMNGRRLKF